VGRTGEKKNDLNRERCFETTNEKDEKRSTKKKTGGGVKKKTDAVAIDILVTV
jgi:hypothetical protein